MSHCIMKYEPTHITDKGVSALPEQMEISHWISMPSILTEGLTPNHHLIAVRNSLDQCVFLKKFIIIN